MTSADDGGVPRPEDPRTRRTGDESVDAVLAELEGLQDAPLPEQLAVLTTAHGALQRRLAATDG